MTITADAGSAANAAWFSRIETLAMGEPAHLYTITHNINSGKASTAPQAQSAFKDTAMQLSPKVPAYDDHVFMG